MSRLLRERSESENSEPARRAGYGHDPDAKPFCRSLICTISDGMKILLAEDDATSAEYIRKGLTEQGYVVDWVTDGRDALTHCLYNPVDLAIVDRMMPGMGRAVAGQGVARVEKRFAGDLSDRAVGCRRSR